MTSFKSSLPFLSALALLHQSGLGGAGPAAQLQCLFLSEKGTDRWPEGATRLRQAAWSLFGRYCERSRAEFSLRFGGEAIKRWIIETTGCGIAFLESAT
jgi:hypothetical protein